VNFEKEIGTVNVSELLRLFMYVLVYIIYQPLELIIVRLM